MSFTTPIALIVLLIAVPVVVYLGWPRMAFRRSRDITSLLLRLVIITLLALALAGTQVVQSADRLAVVFLVDVSDSIGTVAQEAQLEYIRESMTRMGPDDEAGVVLFGADAVVDRPISAVRELAPIRSAPVTGNTDIAEAIRLGLALFPADVAQRMVILSDGRPTVGDTEAAAQLAAAAGVEIDYVTFSREPTPEVQITDVQTPNSVNAG
ncbi:MAG: VWA domain-containing protein, partial [Burkholderiales bacterium]|nr:VWA domain-containing protein [Anaerolineae bacterium]